MLASRFVFRFGSNVLGSVERSRFDRTFAVRSNVRGSGSPFAVAARGPVRRSLFAVRAARVAGRLRRSGFGSRSHFAVQSSQLKIRNLKFSFVLLWATSSIAVKVAQRIYAATWDGAAYQDPNPQSRTLNAEP